MWVLLEETQTKQRGKEIYFKGWTGIGPATTDDLEEAHRFASKEEARMSAAYRHSLSFFEPVEIGLTVKKNKAA
jgi:hypothetical protein